MCLKTSQILWITKLPNSFHDSRGTFFGAFKTSYCLWLNFLVPFITTIGHFIIFQRYPSLSRLPKDPCHAWPFALFCAWTPCTHSLFSLPASLCEKGAQESKRSFLKAAFNRRTEKGKRSLFQGRTEKRKHPETNSQFGVAGEVEPWPGVHGGKERGLLCKTASPLLNLPTINIHSLMLVRFLSVFSLSPPIAVCFVSLYQVGWENLSSFPV